MIVVLYKKNLDVMIVVLYKKTLRSDIYNMILYMTPNLTRLNKLDRKDIPKVPDC